MATRGRCDFVICRASLGLIRPVLAADRFSESSIARSTEVITTSSEEEVGNVARRLPHALDDEVRS